MKFALFASFLLSFVLHSGHAQDAVNAFATPGELAKRAILKVDTIATLGEGGSRYNLQELASTDMGIPAFGADDLGSEVAVQVLGYYLDEDGNPDGVFDELGIYQLVHDSELEDNGGTIIAADFSWDTDRSSADAFWVLHDWSGYQAHVVNVKHFGATDDGTETDDSAAFAAALSVSDVVFVPATEEGFYLSEELDVSGKTLIGAGKRKTVLLVADGVTGLRSGKSSTGTYTRLEGFTLSCDRAVSGVWSSTASKGIYVKNGVDDTATAPTSYVENVELRDLLVEKFYENIEVRGAYWIDLENVEALRGFSDIILNRSGDSSFTGTTLSLRNVWARGTGNGYATPVGSTGITIWHYTDVNGLKVGAEYSDTAFTFRTVQSGTINGVYCEYSKQGIFVHNVTGKFHLKGVYYNNIGDQFEAGGYTLSHQYGDLMYEPHRFTFTDNAISIGTDGFVQVIGDKPASLSGVNAAEYSYINNDSIETDDITAKDQLLVGTRFMRIATVGGAGSAGVNKSLSIVIATGAAVDWFPCTLRLKCHTLETANGNNGSTHYVDFVFSYLDASIVALSTNDILGSGVVSKTGQSVSGSDITVNIDIIAETNAWRYYLEVEAMAGTGITSISVQ